MIPAVHTLAIPAMSDEAIEVARRLEANLLALPQEDIATSHVFHGGMYARTIRIPAGVVATGVLIKIPTLFIISGHATVFIGGETVELAGRHVIPASAVRKQAVLAHTDTAVTMVFATSATTVEEAEAEFTDEVHLLFSRNSDAQNSIVVTGE